MAKAVQNMAKLNHMVIKIFENRNVVNLPSRYTLPFSSLNLPISIGLKLLPKNGMTLCKRIFEALTLPHAFCLNKELNTDRLVFSFNRVTESSSENLLSQEKGIFPNKNASNFLIMTHNEKLSGGAVLAVPTSARFAVVFYRSGCKIRSGKGRTRCQSIVECSACQRS